MSNDLDKRPETGVIELVRGIITDLHMLTKQQLELLKHDIRSELDQVQEAGFLLAVGLAIVVVGKLLLCVMLVHLLASVAPSIPLWGCYGIIGAPVVALGGILCLLGIQKARPYTTPTADSAQYSKEKGDG